MDKGNLVFGDALFHQLILYVVIHVKGVGLGRGIVAEHKLRKALSAAPSEASDDMEGGDDAQD